MATFADEVVDSILSIEAPQLTLEALCAAPQKDAAYTPSQNAAAFHIPFSPKRIDIETIDEAGPLLTREDIA